MQVTYKSSQLLDDQILFKGFAAGGLADVPREAFHSCSMGQTLAQVLLPVPPCPNTSHEPQQGENSLLWTVSSSVCT